MKPDWRALALLPALFAVWLFFALAAYVKETEEAYAEQVRQRLERQLQRRARELGYELRKKEPAAGLPQ
jgi:hypothetical protein